MELQRKIKEKSERRCHPLKNKPWKEKLHYQESALDKKLREEASMEEENERERERERERKWHGKLKEERERSSTLKCVSQVSHSSKVTTSVTHTSIYSLGSFLDKLP